MVFLMAFHAIITPLVDYIFPPLELAFMLTAVLLGDSMLDLLSSICHGQK